MNRLKKCFVIFMAMLLLVMPISNINGASFTVSTPRSVAPNGSIFVRVNLSGEGLFRISVSNGSGGGDFWYDNKTTGMTVSAGSSGTVTITVTAVDASTNNEELVEGTVTKDVTITSGGGGTTPGGESNNSGGGSTGGGSTSDPRNVETEAERIAREEREAEEAKAAEAKKVLISSIEVKSNSDKRRDQVLTEITTEDDNFEYSYNLPTFVDNVIINAVGIDEEVKLEYDTEHLVTEEKKVTIKASKGDISQEYTLTLAPSEREIIKKDDGYIYQDEKLDEAFEALGFEITEIETDGQKTSMFTKGEMHLQMIMDEENQIQFYRLDSNGVTQDKGQLLVVGEDVLFVTSEVSEELSNKTLYGNGYKEVELPLPEFVKEVDKSLKLSNNVKGWTYDENKVVNALDTELKSDLYNLNQENDIKAAVVAFDSSSNVIFYSLIGVSVAFVLTLIGLIVMILKYRKEVIQVRV